MINLFLKAKHWQLFILIFAIPIIFQFSMIGLFFSNMSFATEPDLTIMFDYMKFFPIIILIPMLALFSWFWSVVIGLQKKIPTNVILNIKKFKIFFFIPLIYISVFLLFFSISINGLLNNNIEPNFGLIGSLFAIIIPLHLFSMFCIFHTLYFVAKTIKTVELQQEAKFEDFIGEFFLMWFYPIGIWMIQPKINELSKG
jgi:hypothetical protein